MPKRLVKGNKIKYRGIVGVIFKVEMQLILIYLFIFVIFANDVR